MICLELNALIAEQFILQIEVNAQIVKQIQKESYSQKYR